MKKYRIFLIIPLLLSSTSFFHLNGFLTFGNEYHTFIFTKNHIWDETTHYLLTPLRFLEFGHFSFKTYPSSNETYYFLKDFFSTIQNIVFYFIFELKYIGLVLDIFAVILNLVFFIFFFNKILKYEIDYSFIFSCISIIFFAFGPQTYNEIFGFLTLEPYSQLPSITRHEPTANTNVGFLISLLGLYFFFIKKNYKIFFLTSLVGFFSYIYVSLFYITLCGIIFIYRLVTKKDHFLELLKFISIPIILFLTWSTLMLFMDSEGNLRNTQHVSNSIDLKFLLISIFYIILNLLNYKFTKNYTIKENSIYIILIFISCVVCFYSTLITKVDLGGNDHFYYFANPFQWITLFNIFYNFKNTISKKLLTSFLILIIFIQFMGIRNYSNKYFLENEDKIINQINYLNDLENIKLLVNNKKVLSIDPLFVWFGYVITNSYTYIPNHLDLSVSSDDIMNKYLITSKLFKLPVESVVKYFFKKPNISKRSINFEEIVFAGDMNDGIYEALKGQNLTKSELIDYIKKKYNLIKVNENFDLIVLNKNWLLPESKVLSNLNLIFENKSFLIYE